MTLDIAIVIPPTLDLNTPYAAGPRLAGYLRSLGHRVHPLDLSLELFLHIYNRAGLTRMFDAVDPRRLNTDCEDVYVNRDRYIEIIDDLVAFAQNRDVSTISRIVRGGYLPDGPSFRTEGVAYSYADHGRWGKLDLARFLVTRTLFDLMYLFQEAVTPHYAINSYAEQLATSMSSFDPLVVELSRPPNIVETMLVEVAEKHFPDKLDLVCFTCPFPGGLLSSLVLGRWLGEHRPGTLRALGGGFPSTELRELSDPRIFDYLDVISLDDGEPALRQICARLGGNKMAMLHSTYVRDAANKVVFYPPSSPAIPFGELPAPSYAGFAMDRYVHLIYRLSHVSRLLSEGTWLKLTAAHGCYWKRCTFCDIHLPYIGDYEPMSATSLANQMDAMHEESGQSGFHFTDEACPPALMFALSIELLRRGRSYTWWGNIRYDKAFEPDRCRLLAAAGLVTVTGGIESPSDELLPVIDKGVTVHQLVKVLQAFTLANIRTHGYLIHGFPGETLQNVVDGLEVLRQMIRAGLLHSGFHHRLSVTAHAPLGKDPGRFNLRLLDDKFAGFAKNAMPYEYTDGIERDPELFGALHRAMNSYDRRAHLDRDVRDWFRGMDVPMPTVRPSYVAETMRSEHPGARERSRMCWLGGEPRWSNGLLMVRNEKGFMYSVEASRELVDNIARCYPRNWSDAGPPKLADFDSTEWIEPLRAEGMVFV